MRLSHDPANQISQINADSSDVGYDRAGNMSKLPRVADNAVAGHYVAVYDAWNRLVKLQSEEATPTVYATFAYDGRGRRIGKTVANSGNWNCVYHYYLDGDSLIEVRNGSQSDKGTIDINPISAGGDVDIMSSVPFSMARRSEMRRAYCRNWYPDMSHHLIRQSSPRRSI